MCIRGLAHLLPKFICQRGIRFAQCRPLLIATRRVESRPLALKPAAHPVRLLLTSSTMSGSEFISRLSTLSIKPQASVSHEPVDSPATWRQTLAANPNVPKNFELIKVLVFKPKTAKTAVAIPVIVIARDETETTSNALAKKLNLKELRLASPDLLAMTFGCDKDSCEWSSAAFLLHVSSDRPI